MKKFWFILFLILPFIEPEIVSAHAFGVLYTLPIPVWMYLYGGAAAVALSFLAVGFFARNYQAGDFKKIAIFKIPSFLPFIFKCFSIILFFLVLLSGFFGSQVPTENFATNFFWIILLLGFTYLAALIGNFWETINPWKIIYNLFPHTKTSSFPKALNFLPALIFYFVLIWLEILSGGLGARPKILSIILLLYSTITLGASFIFGLKWFEYGEFFSVFFSILSKASPIKVESGKVSLTIPFSEILYERCQNIFQLIFILFMLSSTAYDGFRATKVWTSLNLTSPYPEILLILSPFLFLSLYLLAIIFMKFLTKTKLSLHDLSLNFAYSLIPIALAYNIAHYYTLLLIQGQAIIALISDPLNLGWNLFGTAGYTINVGILGASFVWNSQVAVIILGHIIAVALAHFIALKTFPHKQAIFSQISMLILMICYTMAGLWILSQPLTVGN